MELFLGIDIGTTHLKVCAVRADGSVCHTVLRDQSVRELPGWGRCFRAEELWEKTEDCLKELFSQIDRKQIRAIGITSMAEAGVAVDSDGVPMTPVVPWNAGQGGPEEADFPASLRGFSLYRKTGLLWHRKYTINQLLSLKTSRPELFERMDCFLSVSDYLFFRLTGERRTEESLACRTMLYNIFEGKWDSELTAFAGVTGKMPPVGKGSAGWPVLKKELASRYGLPDKISVRIGGHDHLCAAWAEGLGEGDVLNSMGTSEVYLGFPDRLPELSGLYERGIQLGVFQGRFYWICNMPSSGASVEWLRSFLQAAGGQASYESLMKQERQVPSKVMYLPFVNGGGTHRKKMIPGGLLGLDMTTGPMDAAQGIYEGIACEARVILELIEDAGLHADRLIAAGGGTRNPLLMQAKADMTGRRFILSQQTQATAAGAAMLAAEAVKEPKCPGDFSGEGSQKEADIERKTAAPRKEYGEACLAKYRTYLALTEAAAREGTKERQEFLWN